MVLTIFTGFVIWLLLSTALAGPLAFFLFCKIIVTALAKLWRPDLILPDSSDAVQIPGNSYEKHLSVTGFVLRLQEYVEVGQFRDLFTQKFLSANHPRYDRLSYSTQLFLGYAFFKRCKIRLSHQIEEVRQMEGETLEDCVSLWLHTPFPKNSPAWGFLLIRLNGGGGTALCFKIHHGLADGYSFLHILDVLTDNVSSYAEASTHTLRPDSLSSYIKRMTEAINHVLRSTANPRSHPFPLMAPNTRDVRKFGDLNLEQLTTIRQEQGVQFTSVVLTVLVRALWKTWPTAKREINLCVPLPWPNHPAKPGPNSGQGSRLCNHYTYAILNVSRENGGSLATLLAVDAQLADYEGRGLPQLSPILRKIFSVLPARLGMMLTKSVFSPVGYTGIIGGDDYTLLGNRVSDIHLVHATNHVSNGMHLYLLGILHDYEFKVSLHANELLFQDRQELAQLVEVELPRQLEILYEESCK